MESKLVRDTTIGARIAIESAEKVLMLVTDPASELWIRKLNSNVESLFDCYVEGRPRLEAYKKMVERIFNNVREGFKVCVVFYGHPVFLFNLHTNLSRLPASKGLVLVCSLGFRQRTAYLQILGLILARMDARVLKRLIFLFANESSIQSLLQSCGRSVLLVICITMQMTITQKQNQMGLVS